MRLDQRMNQAEHEPGRLFHFGGLGTDDTNDIYNLSVASRKEYMNATNSKKRPKIAILVPRYGLVERGVENFTSGLAGHLKGDFEFTVYSRVKTHEDTEKVFAVPESKGFLQSIYRTFPAAKKLMDRYYLDPQSVEMLSFSLSVLPKLLFGTHDLLFPQNGVWGAMVCRIIRAMKGTPFIYRSAGGKEPLIVRQKPDVYVATTPENMKFIREYPRDVKVQLIPNAVDLVHFSPRVKPVDLQIRRPIVLCVGALIPSKRHELAIRAVSKLSEGSLVILGDGPLRRNLEKDGLKLLGKQRFLLRRVKHADIAGYYAAADVFTLPSREEPFGIVYLEALASNLPVVAPDDSTRRYIISRAGFLYPPGDDNSYVKALGKALGKNFGSLPRRQAEKFSWDRVGKEYRKLFYELTSA